VELAAASIRACSDAGDERLLWARFDEVGVVERNDEESSR